MKNKILKFIAVILLLMSLFMIVNPQKVIAGIAPGDITGEKPSGAGDIDTSFVDELAEMVRVIGIFIAVGAMMVIGIKYMAGSIEEKASYKKSMMPYLIGCILLFGASTIAPAIVENFGNLSNPEEIGNSVLGLIQVVGTFAAVAIIMILGIKYMLGSIEERASYKKSMLPFLIGAILLFGAVQLVVWFSENFSLDEQDTNIPNSPYDTPYIEDYSY